MHLLVDGGLFLCPKCELWFTPSHLTAYSDSGVTEIDLSSFFILTSMEVLVPHL